MKSWADTCSSDEESDDDGLHPARAAVSKAIHPSLVEEESSEDEGDYNHHNGNVNAEGEEEFEEDYPPMPLQRDLSNMQLPSSPPFTAHLGNLSYDVQNSNQLSQEIEQLVEFRYRGTERVAVTSARVGVDRESGKMKGYGYIEFATLEELCLVLNLNDGHSQIRGRNLRIDVAQPRRQNDRNLRRSSSHHSHSSLPEIDGTQFRGGRYANRSNSNLNNSSLNSSSSGNLRRNASVSSVGSNASDGGPADASASASGGMPRQRSALRLAPRTKPVGDVSSAGERGSSSDIFGGAKPRDETSWESKRSSSSSLAAGDVAVNAGAGGGKKEDGETVAEKSGGTAAADKKGDGGGTRNNSNGTNNRRDLQRQDRNRSGGGRGNDRKNSAGKLSGNDGKRPNGNGNRRNSALSASSSDTHSKKVAGGGGGRGTGTGGAGGIHKRGSVPSRGGNKGGERGKDDFSGANLAAGGGGNSRKGSSGVSSKAMPVPPVAAKETKAAAPVNKFALLGFDSDSD